MARMPSVNDNSGWKVYVRPDGSADHLPSYVPTDYTVIYHDVGLSEAIRLADEVNDMRAKKLQPVAHEG